MHLSREQRNRFKDFEQYVIIGHLRFLICNSDGIYQRLCRCLSLPVDEKSASGGPLLREVRCPQRTTYIELLLFSAIGNYRLSAEGSGPPGVRNLIGINPFASGKASTRISLFFLFSRQDAKGEKNISSHLYLIALFGNIYLTLYIQTNFVLLIEQQGHLFMNNFQLLLTAFQQDTSEYPVFCQADKIQVF